MNASAAGSKRAGGEVIGGRRAVEIRSKLAQNRRTKKSSSRRAADKKTSYPDFEAAFGRQRLWSDFWFQSSESKSLG